MDEKLGAPGMVSLNAINYSTWKTLMENILYVEDWYKPLINENIPDGVIQKEWEALNLKSVATIRQFVDKSVLQHVSKGTHAFKLWKKLTDMYEQKNATRKASVWGNCTVKVQRWSEHGNTHKWLPRVN